jgi:hypothetical protein
MRLFDLQAAVPFRQPVKAWFSNWRIKLEGGQDYDTDLTLDCLTGAWARSCAGMVSNPRTLASTGSLETHFMPRYHHHFNGRITPISQGMTTHTTTIAVTTPSM